MQIHERAGWQNMEGWGRGSKKIKRSLSGAGPSIINPKQAWISLNCPLKRQSLPEQMQNKIPNDASFTKHI